MKNGFRIMIECGLSAEEEQVARDFADKWAVEVMGAGGSWVARWSRGGWHSYLRRGTFGYAMKGTPTSQEALVFRRISRNRRIFAVMKAKHLRNPDGTEVEIHQYMCPKHLGGTKVIVPEMPEMKQFIEYGVIKG
jgi:hypothetical protein